jgi:DNA polymerase-3 subunit epsilon
MTRALFVDTETTGLPDFSKPANDPCQPHLVQLAWLLSIDGRIASVRSVVIGPGAWEIPAETAAMHGITTDFARAHGDHLVFVLEEFLDVLAKASVFVAHNVHFDRRVLESAAWRCGFKEDSPMMRLRETHALGCTQAANAKIVKARQANGSGKFASLDETHEHYFGSPLRRAGEHHDALHDVIACYRIWHEMERRKAEASVAS